MFRCELTDRNGTADITDMVRNWDEIEASYKRDGYGGVMRSFTSKFEFVNGARERLLGLFDEDYLSAAVRISLSVRGENMEYSEVFSCDMDFTTLEDDGIALSMNAVDNDVASIIKAKKGTSYEYPVSELKGYPLWYDRLNMKSSIKWGWTGSFDESHLAEAGGEADDYTTLQEMPFGYYALPMYILSSEISTRNVVEVYDVSFEAVDSGKLNGVPPMLKCTAENGVDVNVKIDFTNMHYKIIEGDGNVQACSFYVYRRDSQGGTEYAGLAPLSLRYAEFGVRMNKGDELYMYLWTNQPSTLFYAYSGEDAPYMEVTFRGREDPVQVDTVLPETLLNRLLKSMNGGKEGITGTIDPSERLDRAVLCAAESIRGLEGAKIYSSFTNFCEWMEAVFGYVYAIEENSVRFMRREDCYENAIYKHVYEYSDYRLSVDSGLIFSQVNAGYDKQDYESVNGRDEFNFTSQYTTGVLNTESVLELVSPYRADSFGVEFLAHKRGEDTTDSESDKDLFFVGAVLSGGRYLLDRSLPLDGVVSPDTMFNAMFSPSSIIEANKGYIGACTGLLTFASSDGNSGVSIGDEKENRDIPVPDALFSVRSVSFETTDTERPENLNGLVALHLAEKDIIGFISDVDFQYTRKKAARYEIMVKE